MDWIISKEQEMCALSGIWIKASCWKLNFVLSDIGGLFSFVITSSLNPHVWSTPGLSCSPKIQIALHRPRCFWLEIPTNNFWRSIRVQFEIQAYNNHALPLLYYPHHRRTPCTRAVPCRLHLVTGSKRTIPVPSTSKLRRDSNDLNLR